MFLWHHLFGNSISSCFRLSSDFKKNELHFHFEGAHLRRNFIFDCWQLMIVVHIHSHSLWIILYLKSGQPLEHVSNSRQILETESGDHPMRLRCNAIYVCDHQLHCSVVMAARGAKVDISKTAFYKTQCRVIPSFSVSLFAAQHTFGGPSIDRINANHVFVGGADGHFVDCQRGSISLRGT